MDSSNTTRPGSPGNPNPLPAVPADRAASPPRDQDERWYSLDAARGIATLCVVFYHWGHFFIATGAQLVESDKLRPLYWLFEPLYNHAWITLDFFFVLSGAIFFALYARPIAERKITGYQFLALRFSRLYPLHLATLIAAALLQWFFVWYIGHAVIYTNNDLPHFVTNLLFMQNWGFIQILDDVSFNVPAWSISIEILNYILFFVMLCYVPPKIVWFLCAALAGALLNSSGINPQLGKGLWCYFIGGTVAWCCIQPSWARSFRIALYAVTAIMLGLFIVGWPVSPAPAFSAAQYYPHTAFLAALVGCMMMWDRALQPVAKPLSFLGDISYSMYLWHWPLQLVFILAVLLLNGSYIVTPFMSPWMLLVFFSVLIAVGLLSFNLLEVPARRALRSAMLGKRTRTRP